MNWIAANFNLRVEGAKSTFYNFYGIERLGRLSGQRFIGKYDWYREGCENLVRHAGAGRVDRRRGRAGSTAADVISTSFALLFLSKGRTPVLISKFAWGDFQNRGERHVRGSDRPAPQGQVNWNRKHNDTRHIVEFSSQELFKGAPLSWQVYDVPPRLRQRSGAGGKSGKEKILDEVGAPAPVAGAVHQRPRPDRSAVTG